MGKKIRACKACKDKKNHLRKSSDVSKAFVCKNCGASSTEAKQVCKPVMKKLIYSCQKCKRLSNNPKRLCDPGKVT
ncbi:hypothetical protein [uncultured Desulfobacter sp.]|uniref:hypothetical protein n=1 Tax=uncultured Desulfobacter sp. TaxID=240139 RepID=UPI002AAA786D|nr:hypothetical protein [uncultured Desulfobacter sp.]